MHLTADDTTLQHKDREGVMAVAECLNWTYVLPACAFLAETRSEKAKRKLFRNVTVGAYDGTDGPRYKENAAVTFIFCAKRVLVIKWDGVESALIDQEIKF